jgi:hypothetical protein
MCQSAVLAWTFPMQQVAAAVERKVDEPCKLATHFAPSR